MKESPLNSMYIESKLIQREKSFRNNLKSNSCFQYLTIEDNVTYSEKNTK